MVFLGDGYQINEMEKYIKDVRATVDLIFNESPYKEYKNLFNVYAIEVPSKESGTTLQAGCSLLAIIPTAFHPTVPSGLAIYALWQLRQRSN